MRAKKKPAPKIGDFEELILLAIVGLDDEAYGVPIRERLEKAGRSVSVGALYVTLERLQDKGLISSRQGEATPERGGRAKTYYRLTGEGRRALDAAEKVRMKLRAATPVIAFARGVLRLGGAA